MRKSTLILFSLLAGGIAHAAPVLLFTVDTSSMAGQTGSLDFQFNPGPFTTQSEMVNIFNLTGATYITGSQVDSGAVSGGPINAPIAISNSTSFGSNDDFEAVTFGNTFSFEVGFSGPGVDAANGSSLSDSGFVFTIFSDEAGTIASPITTDPGGVVGTATVRGSNGAVSFDAVSSALEISAIPEPASLLMAATALSALIGLGRLRRKA